MWWALGIGIWMVLLLVVLALCRAAGNADLRMAHAHRTALNRSTSDPLLIPERQNQAA